MTGLACACGRPAPGATLCRACTADLRKLLARAETLGADLDVALSRQARVAVAGPGGSGSDEQPLPYSVAASEALKALRGLTLGWLPVVPLAGRTGPRWGMSASADVAQAAAILGRHTETLRQHVDAQRLLDTLRAAVEVALIVIDHPAVVLWVGVCHAPVQVDGIDVAECRGDLYANADDVVVTCRVCRTEHDAQARRVAILLAAREEWLTAAQSARAVKAYGVTTTPSRVRLMASDGDIDPASYNDAGHPLYRLGDVLDELRRPPRPRGRPPRKARA